MVKEPPRQVKNNNKAENTKKNNIRDHRGQPCLKVKRER